MTCELTASDIDVLLESLQYSMRAIGDARGTPPTVRKQNLDRVAAVVEKLKIAKKKHRDKSRNPSS